MIHAQLNMEGHLKNNVRIEIKLFGFTTTLYVQRRDLAIAYQWPIYIDADKLCNPESIYPTIQKRKQFQDVKKRLKEQRLITLKYR